jgi:hypothetical protein
MLQTPETTRFQPKQDNDGWHVVDAWNNDALIAICPKLDAAATLGFFLNGQDSLAIRQREEFLNSIPFKQ